MSVLIGCTHTDGMSVTEDEISSQPETWRRATRVAAPELLAAPGKRALVIGCGTSAFMAMSFAALREAAGCGETHWAYPSEMPLARTYDRVLALSRSGTTTEILDAMRRVDAATTIALTAVPGGPLAALVDHEISLDFADEQSVVQTRFPTAAVTLLRASLGQDLARSIEDAETAVRMPLPMNPAEFEHFVFLGSGWGVGLAHEAALKMREAAQAWSESYPAMDYRHGPIAVAGPASLVWVFGAAPRGLVQQVRATGATVMTNDLDPLAQLVLAQRLAVEMARARGLDPDHPRALTRSVVLS